VIIYQSQDYGTWGCEEKSYRTHIGMDMPRIENVRIVGRSFDTYNCVFAKTFTYAIEPFTPLISILYYLHEIFWAKISTVLTLQTVAWNTKHSPISSSEGYDEANVKMLISAMTLPEIKQHQDVICKSRSW